MAKSKSNKSGADNLEMASEVDTPDTVTVTETPANVEKGPGRPKSDTPTVSGLSAAIKAHQRGTGAMPEGVTYTPSTIDEKHFIVPGKYESREFYSVTDGGNIAVVTRVRAVGPKFSPEVTEVRRVNLAGEILPAVTE